MDALQPSVRILAIDDDETLLALLQEYLAKFDIEAITATRAAEGLARLDAGGIDLVVLDVQLPGMDGFEACKEIRRRSEIPVLMLSARGEAMDRIVGLELGADDYMAKPFEPRELVTRIKAVLRRSEGRPLRHSISVGELEIKLREREAYIGGRALGLTTLEYELLLFLARQPGTKLGREDLQRRIQGFDKNCSSRAVDILVSRLRLKLGDSPRHPKYIKSVHGFGYVFIGKEA